MVDHLALLVELAVLPEGDDLFEPAVLLDHFVDVKGRVVGQVPLLDLQVLGPVKILGHLLVAALVNHLSAEEEKEHVDFDHAHHRDELHVRGLPIVGVLRGCLASGETLRNALCLEESDFLEIAHL